MPETLEAPPLASQEGKTVSEAAIPSPPPVANAPPTQLKTSPRFKEFSDRLRSTAEKGRTGPAKASEEPARVKDTAAKEKTPEKAERTTKEVPSGDAEPDDKELATPPEPDKKAKEAEQIDDDYEREEAPQPPQKGEKLKPWEAAKKWKAAYEATQKELADKVEQLSKSSKLPEISKRAEDAEAKLKELQQELRYLDYTKTEEFQQEYTQPWNEAWQRAARDLAELSITDDEGQVTQATPQHMAQLANMPLGQARKLAKEWFGDAADDVMAHRNKIRELYDRQQSTLEKVRKEGAEKQQRMQELQTKVVDEATSLFSEFKQDDETKIPHLQEKEGDDEWNTRLTKARKLVDSAFAKNGLDPNLSSDERAAIIRKHATIRGRAIAYGPLKLEIKRQHAEISRLQKIIDDYKKAEPKEGDGKSSSEPAGSGVLNTMDAIKQRIRERANR